MKLPVSYHSPAIEDRIIEIITHQLAARDATIAAQAVRIAGLRSEVDACDEQLKVSRGTIASQVAEIERLTQALRGSHGAALLMQDLGQRQRSLIKELVAALTPFAALHKYLIYAEERFDPQEVAPWSIPHGQLKAAQAALARAKEAE